MVYGRSQTAPLWVWVVGGADVSRHRAPGHSVLVRSHAPVPWSWSRSLGAGPVVTVSCPVVVVLVAWCRSWSWSVDPRTSGSDPMIPVSWSRSRAHGPGPWTPGQVDLVSVVRGPGLRRLSPGRAAGSPLGFPPAAASVVSSPPPLSPPFSAPLPALFLWSPAVRALCLLLTLCLTGRDRRWLSYVLYRTGRAVSLRCTAPAAAGRSARPWRAVDTGVVLAMLGVRRRSSAAPAPAPAQTCSPFTVSRLK